MRRANMTSDVASASAPQAAPTVADNGSTLSALQQTAQDVQNLRPVQMLESARNSIVAAVAPKPEALAREVELDEGQSFTDLLSQAGLPQGDAAAATAALAKVYNIRHMQAGQDVTLTFMPAGQQEIFASAVFVPEATKEVTVKRDAQGVFTASVMPIPVVRQRIAARAEIRSSLREAGERAHIPHSILASLIRVYSHEVDFQRDIHPGDRFEVLYDQPMTKYGKPVGEGSIIYAAMQINGKLKPLYRVTFNDGTVDYFDASGRSVKHTLLRTPVPAAHITSGFGMRMHPILGYTKMHKGVDFGAPIGTPIFAAGNGTVEEIGFKGGYGRYIRIRHDGHLGTAYAHMSRFASNLYRGARVNQGQVIGYVGESGRATGPHLHFEVLVNNEQVNPMSVNLPTGRTLEGKLLAQFKDGEGRIQQEFSSLIAKQAADAQPVAVPAAANAPEDIKADSRG
jgi:murein DD-endopeptidase MepM/ murein hydrolase activator NlpD